MITAILGTPRSWGHGDLGDTAIVEAPRTPTAVDTAIWAAAVGRRGGAGAWEGGRVLTIHFVRHGSIGPVDVGPGDRALDDVGRAQAMATAHYFAGAPFAAVYSSPLVRAMQTAAPIAANHGLPLREEVRLRERSNWGHVPGQSWPEFLELWNRATAYPDLAPPGGVSRHEGVRRFGAWVDEVRRAYPEDRVLAATHGGILSDYVLGLFSLDECAAHSPDFPAVMPHCAITTLRYDDAGTRCSRTGARHSSRTRAGQRWSRAAGPQPGRRRGGPSRASGPACARPAACR